MTRLLIILYLLGGAYTAQAHQPDVSTTLLIDRGDNNWVLQIRAALTAFQYEIKAAHGDSAYATPAEFQALVLQHVKDNIDLQFNQQDSIVLEDGFVKLGHETNVIFKVLGVPKNIHGATIKNSSFQHINRNQSALVVLKEGFAKKQFVLNNKNQHTAQLMVDGAVFELLAESRMPSISYFAIGFALLVLGGMTFIWRNFKEKKTVFVS